MSASPLICIIDDDDSLRAALVGLVRSVGYEARGPAGGPLVVATIRSKDRDKGSAFEDAKDLVTLNVGE